MAKPAELLPGTLDPLILKAVSLGKLHGHGVLLRIEQISGNSLHIQQGALYPTFYRLEQQGLIESEWGVSDNNRRAEYYILTSRDEAHRQAALRWRPTSRQKSRWRACTIPARRALRIQPIETLKTT